MRKKLFWQLLSFCSKQMLHFNMQRILLRIFLTCLQQGYFPMILFLCCIFSVLDFCFLWGCTSSVSSFILIPGSLRLLCLCDSIVLDSICPGFCPFLSMFPVCCFTAFCRIPDDCLCILGIHYYFSFLSLILLIFLAGNVLSTMCPLASSVKNCPSFHWLALFQFCCFLLYYYSI